jgi:hypothetical protein
LNRHNSWDDGHLNAQGSAVTDKFDERFGTEKELRNDKIRSSVNLSVRNMKMKD